MRKKTNSILLLMVLSCLQSFPQQFRNTASLPIVNVDSFYGIPITPELSSYLKPDLSDIRIVDEKGQWIPHIINWSLKNVTNHNLLLDLPVLSNNKGDQATTLILDNRSSQEISNLLLVIKNSAASRSAVVSGSDDRKNWFTITDSIVLSSTETISENKIAFRIKLPVVNYQYFKITIYNGGKDPFNIQEVISSVPGDTRIRELYLSNPPIQFTQTDSIGYSLIKAINDSAYHFDKFSVDIASPKFYNRRVKMYIKNSVESIKSLLSAYPDREYVFSSGYTGNYETSRLKDKIIYLLIENNDNPPLKINSITTRQLSKELVSFLEKGHQYKLLFNDSAAVAPEYDLQKFQSQIPGALMKLTPGKISIADKATQTTQVKDSKKQWLWPALIIVLALLGYFTWTFNKDLKKRKNEA